MAVIGPYQLRLLAQCEIPILNRALRAARWPMISPAATTGLTRRGLPPPNGYRGEPGVYYPTGVRNYVRLLPGDDLAGVVFAVLARRLGLRSMYVLDDGSDFWKGLLSDPFRRTAGKLRLRLASGLCAGGRPDCAIGRSRASSSAVTRSTAVTDS